MRLLNLVVQPEGKRMSDKKSSSNEEQIMEKLQQQISINTEKCMESNSE